MVRRFAIIVACFFAFLSLGYVTAQAQSFSWAARMGGPSIDYYSDLPYRIAVDGNGNVYTIGQFAGTADFDPGTSSFNLSAAGSSDVFVSKLNSAGQFVWARRIGGLGFDYANGLALDGTGNVYVTGLFADTVDFDPGPGVYNLTAGEAGQDAFAVKLDHLGQLVWARDIGHGQSNIQVSYTYGRDIALDSDGNVYTTGYFSGSVDFNPGTGTFSLASDANDIFVSKLDSSGNFVWARKMGGPVNDFAFSMAVDAAGDVYTTGTFTNIADFDPGPGIANRGHNGDDSDVFISKLNTAGNFVWAKRIGGPNYDVALDLVLDSSNSILTTGYFFGAADFDPGPGTHRLFAGSRDAGFVSKLDSAGNFIWARNFSGTSHGHGVAVDALDSVYTTGVFQGTVDFDPGPGTKIMKGRHGAVFVSKLSSAGAFAWALKMGGGMQDEGQSIAVDAENNVLTTGWFESIADFDPGPAIFNLVALGAHDIFVSKLSQP